MVQHLHVSLQQYNTLCHQAWEKAAAQVVFMKRLYHTGENASLTLVSGLRLDANCPIGSVCCVANLHITKFCACDVQKLMKLGAKISVKLIRCKEDLLKSTETRQG